MNRRIVLPAAFTVLMVCFALIAMPIQSVGASHAAAPFAAATATATEDACNPQPAVPGLVLSDQFLLDQPNQSGLPLLKVFGTDRVSVLGKNSTGFWVAVESNSGVIGWLPSPQVQVDKKLWGDPKVVPVITDLPTPAATEEAAAASTDEAAMTGTQEAAAANTNPNCPQLDGIVTADKFYLQEKPATRSGDVKVVVKSEKVTVLALNPSGSWVKVQTKTGEIGWIGIAYVSIPPAKLSRLAKDYTVTEATLTPHP